MSKNEGAKFWLSVLTYLQIRGWKDILIVCVDGLSGFQTAIESVYPQAKILLCIVHMIRNLVKYVTYQDRKEQCGDLKMIYSAVNEKQTLKSFIPTMPLNP